MQCINNDNNFGEKNCNNNDNLAKTIYTIYNMTNKYSENTKTILHLYAIIIECGYMFKYHRK